ncbi:MAG TPA: D-2-hydroxyacid dehydrogenase [Gemmatimonadaceae bacterium]|jgi:phosphoglycerate dehydrogenase-like enzyme
MRVLIFITWPVKAWSIPDAQVDALRARFPEIEFVHARTIDEARVLIADADAAFTPFLAPEAVAAAPRLKWVHSPAAAVEGLLPLEALSARTITISNSRGIQAVPIAESVMGGLLVLARKYDRTLEAQRDRRWIQNDLVDDEYPWLLDGKQMTIVGLGTIGIEIARRARAFGMSITGVRRHADREKPPEVDRVFGADELDDALTGCDILVLAAPGVAATRAMIGERELGLLNPGAVLVNIARAAIVDQKALMGGLESGRLGGAVLDVFEKEPLDPGSPLWSMRNVVITPHSSGFRASHWGDVIALYVDNMTRYQNGEPLRYLVDASAGY